MKISVIITAEKLQGWLKNYRDGSVLPTFIIKENATFQSEISENKDINFSLTNSGPLNYLYGLFGGSHRPQVQNQCSKWSLG